MNLLERFFNKTKEGTPIDEPKEYVLPTTFEITTEDVSEYHFMMTGKAKTHRSELEVYGEQIDRKIAAYKEREIFKILNTKLKDLDIQTISVKKPPYVDGNYDLTLSLINQKFLELVFNPSEGVGLSAKMNQKADITLGSFLDVNCPCFLDFEKVTYSKSKKLEFLFKLSSFRGHKDNDNEEMVFLANVDDMGAKSISEYISMIEEKSYTLRMIDGVQERIIIEDLSVSEEDIQVLISFYDNLNQNTFSEISLRLAEIFNNRIAFISIMNGVLIIKGTDLEENTIYTTLKEEELTPDMKSIFETKTMK